MNSLAQKQGNKWCKTRPGYYEREENKQERRVQWGMQLATSPLRSGDVLRWEQSTAAEGASSLIHTL